MRDCAVVPDVGRRKTSAHLESGRSDERVDHAPPVRRCVQREEIEGPAADRLAPRLLASARNQLGRPKSR